MQNNGSGFNNRRWYDSIHNMTQAIHISRELPTEIQALIARSLNEAIEGHRKNRRADKYAVSIGYNRVLGLYKASNGRRWYDPNPVTQRAFNFMGTVPDAFLEELATRILKVANYVEQEHKAAPFLHNRRAVSGTVQSILTEGHDLPDRQVQIRQSKGGIRIVGDYPPSGPKQPPSRG